MIEFENPFVFLLLILIPLLFILRKLKIFKQISFPLVLADWNGKSFVWKDKPLRFLSAIAKTLIVIACVFVIMALANPYKIKQEKQFTSLGTDLVFVVDTSPSMAAKDMDNSRRIDAAKIAISKIAEENSGWRFGVVALGSQSALIVPPTSNMSLFNSKVSQIEIGTLGVGSAIGNGLSTAIYHLSTSSAPKKCVVLLTDGENNAGDIHPETAAKLAAENDVTVYVIGIGTKGTVQIEYYDYQTNKTYSGMMESNFDPSSLKKIALIGKGHYFETTSLDGLQQILKNVSRDESVVQNYSYRISTEYVYKDFLLVAIILFAVAFVIRRFCGE